MFAVVGHLYRRAHALPPSTYLVLRQHVEGYLAGTSFPRPRKLAPLLMNPGAPLAALLALPSLALLALLALGLLRLPSIRRWVEWVWSDWRTSQSWELWDMAAARTLSPAHNPEVAGSRPAAAVGSLEATLFLSSIVVGVVVFHLSTPSFATPERGDGLMSEMAGGMVVRACLVVATIAVHLRNCLHESQPLTLR